MGWTPRVADAEPWRALGSRGRRPKISVLSRPAGSFYHPRSPLEYVPNSSIRVNHAIASSLSRTRYVTCTMKGELDRDIALILARELDYEPAARCFLEDVIFIPLLMPSFWSNGRLRGVRNVLHRPRIWFCQRSSIHRARAKWHASASQQIAEKHSRRDEVQTQIRREKFSMDGCDGHAREDSQGWSTA